MLRPQLRTVVEAQKGLNEVLWALCGVVEKVPLHQSQEQRTDRAWQLIDRCGLNSTSVNPPYA